MIQTVGLEMSKSPLSQLFLANPRAVASWLGEPQGLMAPLVDGSRTTLSTASYGILCLGLVLGDSTSAVAVVPYRVVTRL